MKTEGKNTTNIYDAAYQKYLEAGKRYAGLLRDAMQLDPKILKIAEELLTTGDNLSIHDNKVLTGFYNELRSKSKIDKKYYDLLISLKKAKNDLDIATTRLTKCRIDKVLNDAGIPTRKTSLDLHGQVAHINNPEIGLLEKISYPGVLSPEDADALNELVTNGDLKVSSGRLIPSTKKARDFIKSLEGNVRARINNDYFLSNGSDITKDFIEFHSVSKDIMSLVRSAADSDHIREIERKLDSGDIYLSGGQLYSATERGKRFLNLLAEELTTLLDKKITNKFSNENTAFMECDPRLLGTKKAFDSLNEKLEKHNHFAAISSNYSSIYERADKQRETIKDRLSALMVQAETISQSFLDVKKQLLLVFSNEKVDVDKLLSLLVATRYISNFELDFKNNLSEVETLLGVDRLKLEPELGPVSRYQLTDTYSNNSACFDQEINETISALVQERLMNRRNVSDKTSELLLSSILNSSETEDFRELLRHSYALRHKVMDSLTKSGCLYRGIGDLSCLIEELVELEVEKRLKIAEFTHGLELGHKELWLGRIKNNNRGFIDANFPNISEEIRNKALGENDNAISMARNEINRIVADYRNEHEKQAESFNILLKISLKELKNGADISKVSTKLKGAFKNMVDAQNSALLRLEDEIQRIERKLVEFEKSSQNDLTKVLISDIRKSL